MILNYTPNKKYTFSWAAKWIAIIVKLRIVIAKNRISDSIRKNPRKIVSSDHIIPVTGNRVFWNYKPKQNYKSKMLKKFSELLENAFETMKEGINIWTKDDFGPISFHGSLLRMVLSQISKKYTTLETEVKDQLKYCLTVAERDEKVEGSCLRTIFNSDFFWNWIKQWFVVWSHLKICFWFFQNLFSPTTAGVLFIKLKVT